MAPISRKRISRVVVTGLAALLLVAIAVPGQAQPSAVLDHVMAIQNAHTPSLMSKADVLGTATGLSPNGELSVVVYVNQESPSMAQTIREMPEFLDNVRLVVSVTDPIRAYKGPPGGGGPPGNDDPEPDPEPDVSPTAIQTPPIQLGTSGGWRHDLANGFCCGGTLGSLIEVGGQKRILSNYHVFEADIEPGGNNRVATTGDFVIQPGLIDVSCNATAAQNVATLVVTSALPGNNVDASSAAIVADPDDPTVMMVDESGAILEVGMISATTFPNNDDPANSNLLTLPVKKSGRTTGLTRSYVAGLNATVSVAYDNECAGGAAFTKTFTGQIIMNNRGQKFLRGGDSGSVAVEDVSSNPRAVGLLFAGSKTVAVANPIDEVLGFLGATMVGN